MKPHALADQTLEPRYFVVSSGNTVEVTPMMRRRTDGRHNIAIQTRWSKKPTEADVAEFEAFFRPFLERFTPLGPGIKAASDQETEAALTQALLMGERTH